MTNVVTASTGETANPSSDKERIATLEERSLHAATKAELHRALFASTLTIIGLLGGGLVGLIIHLHNITLTIMDEKLSDVMTRQSEIQTLLNELLLRASGG